jgi:hypothetical protein
MGGKIMNINSVSAGNVPAAGQTTGETQTAQTQNASSSEAVQTTVPSEKVAEEPAVKVEIGKAQTTASNEAERTNAVKVDAQENVFQTVLKELDSAVAERTKLLKAMPPDVREVTQEIISKTLADAATISEGMMATIRAEKSVVEQLQTFISLLTDAEQISQQVPKDMLKSFADLLQNLDTEVNDLLQKAVVVPEQAAEESPLAAPGKNNAQPVAQGEDLPDDLPQQPKMPENGGNKGQILQANETRPNQPGDKAQPPVNTHSLGQPEPAAAPTADLKPSQQPEQAKDLKVAQPVGQTLVNDDKESPQLAANKNNSQSAVKPEQPSTAPQPKADNLIAVRQDLPQEVSAKSQPGGQANVPVPEEAQNTAKQGQAAEQPQPSTGGKADYQPKQSASRPDMPQARTGQNVPTAEGQSDLPSLENTVLNLAKQLAGSNSTQQNTVKNAVLQFMQQSSLPQSDDSPEAVVLKQTLENFAQNAPEIVKFAAGKHNLPQLPQLWALVKMHKALEWTKLDQEKLQQTIRSMREMTTSMKKSMAFSGEKIDNNTALSFSMPLYLGEGMQPYPAYIHLYHQRQQGAKENGEYSYETWLRICLGTENIGPVDLVFRLYQENLLNVKVAFSQDKTAQSFSRYLPDIREALDESALNLVEVSVNTKPDLGG